MDESADALRFKSNGNAHDIRLSIIIPTLNEEKMLPQMLAQFTPAARRIHGLEIIISDGGSSDRTLAIAETSADSIVRHTLSRVQTIAEGRNNGAAVAHGAILMFMNADTLIASPEDFFNAVENAYKNPECEAIAFPIKIFPNERTAFDSLFHGIYNKYVHGLNIVGIGMGRGECQAVRTETFRRVNGYDETLTAGEDFDLFRRLRKTDSVRFLAGNVVYESPRRYRKFGYRYVVWSWFKNAVSVIFAHKSVSDTWEQVR